ncbi:MAG: hypothetical protein WCL10_15740 [Novosphingobium sp.]|jgi:hypothetical protein
MDYQALHATAHDRHTASLRGSIYAQHVTKSFPIDAPPYRISRAISH